MTETRPGEQLTRLLEQGSPLVASLGEEVKAQFRALLESQIGQLGLITREEFDALRTSLERAAVRIEELETKLEDLSPNTRS